MSAALAPAQVAEPVPVTEPAIETPAPAPAGEPEVPTGDDRSTAARVVVHIAVALTFLLVLVIGFATYLYGLSGLSEHRAQTNMRKTFSHALAQAVAPIRPTTEGAPVAALDIPQLGLHEAIVVEGTSSQDLTNGPGHRADTVLPGQYGVSVIYGRKITFGGPFAHLLRLQVGDRITATTGQGVSIYRVSSFGDEAHPAPANSDNRLVLTTADSAGVPESTVSVSADLITKPLPVASALPSVPDSQKGLAFDVSGTLLAALLWSQALLALALATTFGVHRWSVSATYLAATPLAFLILWNLFENLACLLPNLY